MTHSAALFLDPHHGGPRPPSNHPARRRWGPLRKGAIITTAAVAAGFAVLMTVLPPPQTPDNVAAAFVQARFEGDASRAWDLLCGSSRATIDFAAFSEQLAYVHEYLFMPSEVDVEVDDVRVERAGGGSFLEVAVTVTSDERGREDREFPGDVRLVEEKGELRVCFAQDTPVG